jgi:hypothetical protein
MIYPMPPTRPAHLIILDLRHSNNIWRSYQLVEIPHKAADVLVFTNCRCELKKSYGEKRKEENKKARSVFGIYNCSTPCHLRPSIKHIAVEVAGLDGQTL